MKTAASIHNGQVIMPLGDFTEEQKESIRDQVKRQLIQQYMENCAFKTCQIDHPSNEGRVYTVEI